MIRLALGKGRNLPVTLEAFRAAGFPLESLEEGADRRLIHRLPEPWVAVNGGGDGAAGSGEEENEGVEVLLLKDADIPLYVAYGIADLGVVGSDVLEESDGDLLVPVVFTGGHSRLSFIGRPGSLPSPGSQIRLVTKYPEIARRVVAERPWGAQILKLSGSVELGPLLDLAELALDIVQTGRTIAEHDLEELEVVRPVTPCLAVNRASFLRHRRRINDLVGRLEAAGVVE